MQKFFVGLLMLASLAAYGVRPVHAEVKFGGDSAMASTGIVMNVPSLLGGRISFSGCGGQQTRPFPLNRDTWVGKPKDSKWIVQVSNADGKAEDVTLEVKIDGKKQKIPGKISCTGFHWGIDGKNFPFAKAGSFSSITSDEFTAVGGKDLLAIQADWIATHTSGPKAVILGIRLGGEGKDGWSWGGLNVAFHDAELPSGMSLSDFIAKELVLSNSPAMMPAEPPVVVPAPASPPVTNGATATATTNPPATSTTTTPAPAAVPAPVLPPAKATPAEVAYRLIEGTWQPEQPVKEGATDLKWKFQTRIATYINVTVTWKDVEGPHNLFIGFVCDPTKIYTVPWHNDVIVTIAEPRTGDFVRFGQWGDVLPD